MNAPAQNRGDGGGRMVQLSMLPEPEFSPLMPPSATLADKLLRRLLDGESLTHRDFEDVTSSWRLAAYVHDLRELGWPVDTQEIAAPSPECPSRVIARYSLPDWVQATVRGCHAL
jgi:hypothetical protein